jgi:hypothetical protein
MKAYKEWPGAAGAILLILAVFSWPYGYYIFLRWAISAIAVYVAYALSESKDNKLWIFVGVMVVFNPVVPIYLERSLWIVIDFVSAGFFLAFSKQDVVRPKVTYKVKSVKAVEEDELDTWENIKDKE